MAFAVYTNPVVSAALTSSSLRPKASTFVFLLSLLSASSLAFFHLSSRGSGSIDGIKLRYVSKDVANVFTKMAQVVAGLTIAGTLMAFIRATSLWRSGNPGDKFVLFPSEGSNGQTNLSKRQLTLLGIKPKVEEARVDSAKRPPKTKPMSSPSETLVPLHQPISSNRSVRSNGDKTSTKIGSTVLSYSTPTKSPSSPSLYLVSPPSLSPSFRGSPGIDQFSTPWSNKRAAFQRDITTEEAFEKFLADVDDKISGSASKLSTPPPTTNGFGVATPNNISSSANASGTARSTPLRPVRMSPTSQKFTTPPKKGEGDFPSTMSIEESIEAFEQLGIYPQIEQWRDHLRQWFSSVLINPLLDKIGTSHLKILFPRDHECGVSHWT